MCVCVCVCSDLCNVYLKEKEYCFGIYSVEVGHLDKHKVGDEYIRNVRYHYLSLNFYSLKLFFYR